MLKMQKLQKMLKLLQPMGQEQSKTGDLIVNGLESSINRITSNPVFLRCVSTFINFNSYRKIWLQTALEGLLKQIQLPVRRDQEKLLALVQELEIRIKRLQLDQEIRKEDSKTLMQSLRGKQVNIKPTAIKQIKLKTRRPTSVRRMDLKSESKRIV